MLKPRSSVVFHELQEVYERSTNGYPYKVPQFDGRGYSKWGGDDGVIWDESKRGNSAHYRSEDKENNFHEKSNYPGKVDK